VQCIGNGLDYNGLRNPVLNQFNMAPCNMRSDSRTGNGERFYNCELPALCAWLVQTVRPTVNTCATYLMGIMVVCCVC
jgi:hypothetical protein